MDALCSGGDLNNAEVLLFNFGHQDVALSV